MKTSTILLLTYFGLLLAGVLALFIASKTLGENEAERFQQKFNSNYKELPDFSVVVLQDSAKCKVIIADSSSLIWQWPNDKPMPAKPVFVRNDTLFVTKSLTGNTWDVCVKCKSLKVVITSQGSCARIIDPKLKNLTLIGNGGEIFVENENANVNRFTGENLILDITAKAKSNITLSVPVKKLNATSRNSRVYTRDVYMIGGDVTLNLSDSANVELYGCPLNLTVKKDSTCWVNMN
jgi:hypothetical protein